MSSYDGHVTVSKIYRLKKCLMIALSETGVGYLGAYSVKRLRYCVTPVAIDLECKPIGIFG